MTTESEERLKTIQHYSYYLNDSIGKGFSSTVYKGKNKLNGIPVAIKVIDLRKLSQSTMRQLLNSQIGIVRTLNHENLLKCQNVFVTVNNCYIITELCQGGDLASQIKKKGRLRGIQALKIMLEIAKGISHLANLNIIHRDIKPANILLHHGLVKIADFGFAKYQDQKGKKQKYSVGSPLYMSPQAIFSNFYSKENDIWSLGVVFYEILQGRPPWDPKNQKQLKQILKEKKQIFFRIAVRDELETIIRGCLKHQRNQRMSLQYIISILEQMMKQMMSEDNIAYRQTLTKRSQNTLSCKVLNTQTTSVATNNIISRPLIPKIPKPPSAQVHLLKQNSKNQSVATTIQTPIISRNRSAIELKQRLSINVPLQQASRHNHRIVKSVVNYSRLIYKNFSRIDKLEVNQYLRLEIQKVMVDLLQYSIVWLRNSVTILKDAQKFGIVNFLKFKQTGCYSKTLLIINEYYQRYTKFVSKMRRFLTELSDKKNSNNYQENTFNKDVLRLKNLIKQLNVVENKNQHNIGVDFILTIAILTQMLATENTTHFAQNSHIEQIVQTEPIPITDYSDIKQLKEKLQILSNSI